MINIIYKNKSCIMKEKVEKKENKIINIILTIDPLINNEKIINNTSNNDLLNTLKKNKSLDNY
jgi:hypothetical protein